MVLKFLKVELELRDGEVGWRVWVRWLGGLRSGDPQWRSDDGRVIELCFSLCIVVALLHEYVSMSVIGKWIIRSVGK